MKTRKRFGQYFLHDPGVLKRIVEAIDPAPGDAIVEIGPGEGALTRPLLERVAHLTAIEIDRDLAATLSRDFPAERLSVVCADVLDFDFSVLPPGLRVVGNLPYNISTPILFHLANYAGQVRDMHFMLQREVVQRMVAKHSTPDYGRLSVMLQTRFRMQKLFNVAPGAFRPPPKVESAVVRLVPIAAQPDWDQAVLERIVRQAFSARRKTLRNALPLEPAEYEELGIDPKLRPENLSPADYLRITRRVCAR
ncbi:MAG: 16S rRNA (adenine(1518)-N(6)/adenine(1519)-N(6))-dimethyltransferase RsmA [Betaproteobacteria bacterium]|nr:16S rRNA (adenine(1518)-N(6)/adenine(1519)-N(6))-dimethyltransferase RsmA [Betaproteobacteria bacterium]